LKKPAVGLFIILPRGKRSDWNENQQPNLTEPFYKKVYDLKRYITDRQNQEWQKKVWAFLVDPV
jgi:hypothetical protein